MLLNFVVVSTGFVDITLQTLLFRVALNCEMLRNGKSNEKGCSEGR